MMLLLQVAKGRHPVEAMLEASLDVLPIKRGRRTLSYFLSPYHHFML